MRCIARPRRSDSYCRIAKGGTQMTGANDKKLHRGAPVGVAVTEATRQMRGVDILRGVMNGSLPAAGISRSLNFWIDEVEEGRVVFAGEPGEESLNPMGAV